MLVAFIPVLHAGYLELFKQYPDELGILGADVIADYTPLMRDLRLIEATTLKTAVESLGTFKQVRVLSKQDLVELGSSNTTIVMPDEDISHELADKYFGNQVTFVSAAIRHRWDKQRVTQENVVAPDRIISSEQAHLELMAKAQTEAGKAADWWRQVGAVIVKAGQVLARDHNRHLPSEYQLGYNGDPRSNVDAGQSLEISTAIHAEASMIAQAARAGLKLDGAAIFVTTFPCPNCARLLAEAGISEVYYEQGYSRLDAEELLKAYNIKITLVKNSAV